MARSVRSLLTVSRRWPQSIARLQRVRNHSTRIRINKNKRGGLRRPASKSKAAGEGARSTLALRSLAPARQILFLLRAQPVDLDSHRLQLQLGNSLVEFVWHAVDLFLQRLEILDHVLDRQRLVGEAHVHDRRGMSFGGGQIDEPSFAEKVDLAAIFQR